MLIVFFRVRPETIRVYLCSLRAFLVFLTGNFKWLRHLSLTSDRLKTTAAKMAEIHKSLKEDVLKDEVES